MIHIPLLHTLASTPTELSQQLIEQYQVPEEYQFPLFHRIRLAAGFHDYNTRTILVHIQLSTFAISAQAEPSSLEHSLTTILSYEPDYIEELLEVISSSDPSISQVSKVLALRACRAIAVNERSRATFIIKGGCNSPDGIIPTTLKKSVNALISGSNTGANVYSRSFVEALLNVLLVIAYPDSGATALAKSGIASTLKSLISHSTLDDSSVCIVSSFISLIELEPDVDELILIFYFHFHFHFDLCTFDIFAIGFLVSSFSM
jgi:hypothetical protein